MAMDRELKPEDEPLDKIRKLLPTEVSGAFLALNSIVPAQADVFWIYSTTAILVVACWLYLRSLAGISNILQLAFVSVIAFPAWAANIAVDRIDFFDGPNRFIAAVIVVIVSVFIPLIIRTK